MRLGNQQELKPLQINYAAFRREYLKKRAAASSSKANTPQTATNMVKLFQKLSYGDALVRRGYRFEYVQLERGFPHYRLYKGDTLIGIQDVRSPKVLPRIWNDLAACLMQYGFTPQNSYIVICGARTPWNAPKWASPYLLKK